MNRRGLAYGLASVALVSAAQLSMRWSMMRLPTDWTAWADSPAAQTALAVLLLGVAGYGASLVCWLAALAVWPLNRLYPLLSLSYVLVYLGAGLWPALEGRLTPGRSVGVVLILAGVALVSARSSARAAPAPRA